MVSDGYQRLRHFTQEHVDHQRQAHRARCQLLQCLRPAETGAHIDERCGGQAAHAEQERGRQADGFPAGGPCRAKFVKELVGQEDIDDQASDSVFHKVRAFLSCYSISRREKSGMKCL